MYEEYLQYMGPKKKCITNDEGCTPGKQILWAQDGAFQAYQCSHCGVIAMNPSLTPEGLSVYYDNNIKRRFNDQKKTQDRDIQYEIDRDYLERFICKGNVLDVGCNGGFFLNKLSDHFDKYGIELDPVAVDYAISKFGYDVRQEIFGEDSFKEESMDLIVFRGVIEHLYNPRIALERAAKILKPGGKLFFSATPNSESFCADAYREKWNLWHPIQHIYIFSVRTLGHILEPLGLKFVAEEYPYLGTPYANRVEDYAKFKVDLALINSGRRDQVEISGPFWGNMLTAVFEKSV